jgi:outer membrane immunogenic protein
MNKKLLLASTVLAGMAAAGIAQAADLAPVYKAPPPPVVAPAMWTGFYIGAHVGGGWGTKEWSEPFFSGKPSVNLPSFNVNGPLAGGQIGYNWQSGWVVFGVEADASWADIKGKTGIGSANLSSKVDSLGTIVGRIGGTVDHALLYVLGGAAWVHDKHTIAATSFLDCDSVCSVSSSKFRWGWTLGGGVEYAFTPQWSGKIQYNYMDFGTKRATFCVDGDCEGLDITQRMHTVKVGLNYHFNWAAPVSARY